MRHFNPRSPHGERRYPFHHRWCADEYFNPRSPHGERQKNVMGWFENNAISIHAPRTGSDWQMEVGYPTIGNFNPRSPHGERRTESCMETALHLFQSTLPARGATFRPEPVAPTQDISIHAPRTGSDVERLHLMIKEAISIHAPRTGSDAPLMEGIPCTMYFNPRSPHGERPTASGDVAQPLKISIHAPRTGSDKTARLCIKTVYNISIHAPRTGSDPQTLMDFTPVPFQSTLPARGATPGRQWRSSARRISIHAPRTGSDGSAGGSRGIGCLFQSTLPARGATYSLGLLPRILSFQSTLPARGATKHPNSLANLKKDFNPRSPHGERLHNTPTPPAGDISIHAPRTGSDLIRVVGFNL